MAEAQVVARMAAWSVVLGEDTLRRISPALLSVRREFVKRVTAFFTDGKDHPTWASTGTAADSTAAQGVVVRVINTGADQELRGTVAVDVALTAGPRTEVSMMADIRGGSPRISSRSAPQRFRQARRGTMQCLVHELRHVMKYWDLGLVPMSRRNVHELLYDAAYARDGYTNVFEKDAFAFASDWMAANGGRVDAGEFDEALPLDMIRRYAPG